MKRRVPVMRLSLFLIVVVVSTLFGFGCSQTAEPREKAKVEQASAPKPKEQLIIGSGGTGGSAYHLCAAVADLITRKAPNIEATVQATGGSVENTRLVASKEIEMAHTTELYKAWNGLGAFKDNPVRDIRVLMQYGSWATHIVTLDSLPINTVYDLKGKRVGVGPPGSGTEINARAILKGHGMTFEDIKAEFLSFTEQAQALRDGTIQAGFMMLVPPGAAVMDLVSTHKVKLISVGGSELQRILKDNPEFSSVVIPAGTYAGVDKDTVAINNPGHLIVHKDMPDDLAYTITKVILENLDELRQANAAFKILTPQIAAQSSGVPLHPGSERYFREKGLLK